MSVTFEITNLGDDACKKIRKDPLALISLTFILLYVVIGILANLGIIASDFATTHNEISYAQPSSEYWFGTDFLGRSVLSRAIQGTRIALVVGFFSAIIATLIGFSLGAIAGYFGKWVDDLIVWFYTTVDSIPYILLISANRLKNI